MGLKYHPPPCWLLRRACCWIIGGCSTTGRLNQTWVEPLADVWTMLAWGGGLHKPTPKKLLENVNSEGYRCQYLLYFWAVPWPRPLSPKLTVIILWPFLNRLIMLWHSYLPCVCYCPSYPAEIPLMEKEENQVFIKDTNTLFELFWAQVEPFKSGPVSSRLTWLWNCTGHIQELKEMPIR